MVRGETEPPYNRTAASKALLDGTLPADAVTLPESDSPGVEWTGPDLATALDPGTRTVTLTSDRSLHYEHVIIATGSSPHA